MSSSMQAYRTELAVAQSDFYAAINAVLAEVFDGWLESSQIVKGSDSTSEYTDYKISTSLWLRVRTIGFYYVYDNTEGYWPLVSYSDSSSYTLTVLKVNHCLIFCVENTSSLAPYTLQADFIIDSINNDNTKCAIIKGWDTGSTFQIDTESAVYSQVHSSFNGYSYNASGSTLQVSPFIISIDGAKCDNLYNIAVTPLNSAKFASFNGQIWWINDGHFALCAGDSEPTYTVVTPTS